MRTLRSLLATSFPFLALLYFAMFCAFGAESPFFPSFLSTRTLSSSEIGTVLAAGMVVRLAAGPVLGLLADRFGARLVLGLASAFAGTVGMLYLSTEAFWPLLAISMSHSLVTAPLNPLADALALTASSREGIFSYGWIRGIGSASFVLGTFVSGAVVARFGIASIIVVSSALFLLEIAPIPMLLPVERTSTDGAKGAVGRLLSITAFRDLLLVAGLIIGSHAASDAFAVIHWRSAGIRPTVVSALWSEAVVSEIVVFVWLGPALLQRLGPARCALVSGVAGILRWSVLALTTEATALAAVQLLHGLTFSLMHLACMGVIARRIPERLSGTAQNIYGALCLGLASAVLTWISGEVYGTIGANVFWLMALLCVAALPFTPRLQTPEALPDSVEAQGAAV